MFGYLPHDADPELLGAEVVELVLNLQFARLDPSALGLGAGGQGRVLGLQRFGHPEQVLAGQLDIRGRVRFWGSSVTCQMAGMGTLQIVRFRTTRCGKVRAYLGSKVRDSSGALEFI